MEASCLDFHIGVNGGNNRRSGIGGWGDGEGEGLAGQLDDAWAVELIDFVEFP